MNRIHNAKITNQKIEVGNVPDSIGPAYRNLELYAIDSVVVLAGLPGVMSDGQAARLASALDEPHYYVLLEGGLGSVCHDVVLTDGESFQRCGSSRFVSMSVLIPKYALLQADRHTPLLPMRLSTQAGFGHLLSNVLLSLPDVVGRLDSSHHAALAASVISVVKAAYFDALPEQQVKCRMSTLDRIKANIVNTLSSPELTPGDVSQQMGISLRYLHQLFAESGETFMTYLQRQRVERIAKDLCDPENNETITECAFRWGFNDPSHFSRVFRRLKGCTATAYIAEHRDS